jgi:hypothetical protein
MAEKRFEDRSFSLVTTGVAKAHPIKIKSLESMVDGGSDTGRAEWDYLMPFEFYVR